MKNLLFHLTLCGSLLAACQNNSTTGKADDDKDDNDNNISKRDYSITRANAYSTLFLDSTAVEKFLSDKKVTPRIARRIRSFYNTRNYQFAWFSGDGLTEQALAFWNLHDYVTTYDNDTSLRDKALQKRMDALVAEEDLSVSASDKSSINTELTLTQHFIQYILNNYEKGYVKRKEMERFIPFKKEDPMALADSLLNKKHKDDKYFEDVNQSYKLLKDQLAKYYNIAKQGGWPQVTTTKKSLKKGITDPAVAVMKKRLQLTGDLAGNGA